MLHPPYRNGTTLILLMMLWFGNIRPSRYGSNTSYLAPHDAIMDGMADLFLLALEGRSAG